MTFKADLHVHTTCSDGSLTSREVLQLAKLSEIGGLSLTDHDTIAAYHRGAFEEAAQEGVFLLPGVEFSAQEEGHSIHILAYAFSPNNTIIQELCAKHVERRLDRNDRILARLKKYGLPISVEDLGHHPYSIGRPHIAQAMVSKGYVNSLQEAFLRYLGEGRPCFDIGKTVSVEETIASIRAAGGRAVLAHPHLIEDKAILKKLLEMPFDGLEVFYGRYPLDQVQSWREHAEKRGWLMTGGSDFHGNSKPNNLMGSSWAPTEVFEELLHHFSDQQKLHPIN